MKAVKSRKSKVTLSVGKEFVFRGKQKSLDQKQSLSKILKDRINEKMRMEKKRNYALVNSLKKLVPELKKKAEAVNWKTEIRDAITGKNS